MAIFTTSSFLFAAIVRERCKDRYARIAARLVGITMFTLLILFSWEMTTKVETLTNSEQACEDDNGDHEVLMLANKQRGK